MIKLVPLNLFISLFFATLPCGSLTFASESASQVSIKSPRPISTEGKVTGNSVLFGANPGSEAEFTLTLSKLVEEVASQIESKHCNKENTLVAYDLDETVMILNRSIKDKAKQAVEIGNSSQVITSLKEMGVVTLALTARQAIQGYFCRQMKLNHGIVPKLEGLEDTRMNLKSIGIDIASGSNLLDEQKTKGFFGDLQNYSKETPSYSSIESTGVFWLKDKESFDLETDCNLVEDALFYEPGLLMAAFQNKGEALKKLLEKKGLIDSLSCIFFVDNEVPNLKDVQKAFQTNKKLTVFLFQAPQIKN